MGDGTEQNPYTREDVLKAIKKNGGTAKGLDLSEKWFEEGIDLSGLDLGGVMLNGAVIPPKLQFMPPGQLAPIIGANLQGVNLAFAQLKRANLWDAHLEHALLGDAHLEGALLGDVKLQGANLIGARLEGANLNAAHLERAHLRDAHLEGVFLQDAKFSPDTELEHVNWGNYKLGEENGKDFHSAKSIYRQLKLWYTNAGAHDIAAEFYYREKEATKKSLKLLSTVSWYHRLALEASYLVFGHGEGWKRLLLVTIPSLVGGFAVIYYVIGTLIPNTFWNSLYYSAVSFTALGYGKWAPEPTGWVKGLGAFEAFIGVFMMALFLITFVRKMTR